MTVLVALSIAIAALATVATWGFLTAGSILIWAAFIGWASFFHCGGDQNALKKTIVGNLFGVIVAWVAALVITKAGLAESLGLPLWAALVVGITVLGVCLAAHLQAFNVIPASFYGYACAFAYLLQTPDALAKLTSPTLGNVLFVVPLSMIIGAFFGFTSGKLGGMLQAK